METTITATELSKRLSDVLNRVKYRGERFIVQRNGETIATIAPVSEPAGITWGEFLSEYFTWPRPDPGFADDLEAILNEREMISDAPEWPE